MQGDFFLTTWIFQGMQWLYENLFSGSIVLTIIVSTILIRAITLIGDVKSRKSSMKMNAIQPELQRIQKKYKDNPQKLQQAQSKLMRENGVSMLGGCLPMLIMMPLFFCFIAAFRHWGNEQMVRVLMELNETGDSQLFESFRFLWVNNIWQADNGLKPVVQEAATFLANKDLSRLLIFQENPAAKALFEELGFFVENVKEIPQASIDNYNALVAPLMAKYEGFNNGWFILPALAGVTSFLSGWIMQKGQPQNESTEGMNKTMKWMMPAVSVFACLSSNAAFAVYWVMSNLLTTGTSYLINKALNKTNQQKEQAR